ncbi:Structural maintenance of chromosomes protein 2 [Exaiptasia diaphana]|nr:Structural maintenance of chromosomes protein 2 [Exaiptasia diaphana]
MEIDLPPQVTYDPKVKSKTVTVEGDIFDPSGTLTGGSKEKRKPILSKFDELIQAQNEIKNIENKLQKLKQEIENCKNVAVKYQQLKEQYDLKVHEAELAQERLKQTSHHQQLEEVKALENTVEVKTHPYLQLYTG